MIILLQEELLSTKENLEKDSKKLNEFIMDDPSFLDLPEKEQQNWKHLYNKMCQFLDAINVTLTNQT